MAKAFMGNFHALNAFHIVALSTSAYEMIYNKDTAHSAEVLKKNFTKYEHFYDQAINTFLSNEPILRNEAETAISNLASDKLTKCFFDVHAYIKNIQMGNNHPREVHRIAVFRRPCNDRSQNMLA